MAKTRKAKQKEVMFHLIFTFTDDTQAMAKVGINEEALITEQGAKNTIESILKKQKEKRKLVKVSMCVLTEETSSRYWQELLMHACRANKKHWYNKCNGKLFFD